MSLQDLRQVCKQANIVAGLQNNERPCVKEGVIVGKYSNPASSYFPFWSSARQALQRGNNAQSTAGDAAAIQNLAEKILTLTAEEGVSRYDYFMNFCERCTLYKELSESLDSAVKTGLIHWEQTATTSSANVIAHPEAKKLVNQRILAETIDKVERAKEQVLKKVEAYQNIEALSFGLHSAPISRKEHLEDLLRMLCNPGHSGKTESINVSHQKLPARAVKELFTQSFGEGIVDDVFALYSLHEEKFLCYQDFQALFIGLVANLTQADVNYILHDYSNLLCSIINVKPAPANLAQIQNEAMLPIFLESVRDIDVGGASCPEGKKYAAQLKGDLAFLASCKNVAKYNYTQSQYATESPVQALKQFGYTEHLARDYVYTLFDTEDHRFRNGILFPQYDQNGALVCREGYLLLNKEAVMALAVKPTAKSAGRADSIQVVFRGTYDYNSLKRDFSLSEKVTKFGEWEGPGRTTFEKHSAELYRNLLAFLAKHATDDTALQITGHSLGACDAQRLTALLADKLVGNPEDPVLGKLKRIDTFTYNAPAVEKDINLKFIENVRKLDKPFHLRGFVSYGDVVSNCGTCFLGFLPNGQTKPERLHMTQVEFLHITEASQTDCLHDTYQEGCVTAIKKTAMERAYAAHSLPYFIEAEGLYLAVRCYSTTDVEAETLFPERDKAVASEHISHMLTTTPKFDYNTYALTRNAVAV